MEKLKDVVVLKGLGYDDRRTATLVKRTKRKAMYLRSDGYYEIFKVKVSPPAEMFGKSYPEREVYPGNEDFGKTAYCCTSKERAERRYQNL